ncbi:11409_t:CDS:2 [Ambispora gerdemannii]|uniref:11409_t:CDS:1 n=1 Tax=Ambispora gerdemannii TaxID=144530 RepID=A0A9N9BWA5_9GLOM|nr:11409_t:CDS:2 [Ambispora gerdemannii]
MSVAPIFLKFITEEPASIIDNTDTTTDNKSTDGKTSPFTSLKTKTSRNTLSYIESHQNSMCIDDDFDPVAA